MREILEELREIREQLQLNQPVFTFRQFCKFADISEDYGYRLLQAGKIKFNRPFGKKIYLDRDDVIETLLKHSFVGITKNSLQDNLLKTI